MLADTAGGVVRARPRGKLAGAAVTAQRLATLGLLLSTACAEPAEPPPSLYDDPTLAAQVADNDGFDGVAPRFSAFVAGRPVRYWTIGVGGERAMPAYVLCRPEGEEACAPIDHPPIVGALPGDPEYSPFLQVHRVALPEGWQGQLTSVAALEAELAALGLDAPRPGNELLHCPIAAPDAEIEVADAVTVGPARLLHVRDLSVRCFDFSATRPNRSVFPDGSLFIRNVYVLTREGEELPLSEPMREVDLTGDGDMVDSNNVFGVDLADDDYTPLWRVVRVTVPAGLGSIDTYEDDTMADYRDAHEMFDVAPDYTITPRADRVVDHVETETLINCPLQSAEGTF